MLNNDDDSWTNVTYKKPQRKLSVPLNAIVITDENPKKPMVIPTWKENKEWRYLTKYDYTLTSKEEYKYENMTRSIMKCNCICCDCGETATEILGRLVVACQRCFCCCGDDAENCSDNYFAINRKGNVVYIGENGKLPENDECY
jgi:hypothetical protein